MGEPVLGEGAASGDEAAEAAEEEAACEAPGEEGAAVAEEHAVEEGETAFAAEDGAAPSAAVAAPPLGAGPDGVAGHDWASIVSQDWQRLAEAPAEVRADPGVICEAMRDSGGEALQFASDELRGDREFLVGAAQEMGPAVLEHALPSLRADREFIMEVADFCSPGDLLWHVPDEVRAELLSDRDFVLEAIQQVGAEVLEHCSVELRGDRSFIEAAAQFCLGLGEAVQYATDELRRDFMSDRSFMLQAVREAGVDALEEAAQELRGDRAFILAVARECAGGLPEVLPYASEPLRAALSRASLPKAAGSGIRRAGDTVGTSRKAMGAVPATARLGAAADFGQMGHFGKRPPHPPRMPPSQNGQALPAMVGFGQDAFCGGMLPVPGGIAGLPPSPLVTGFAPVGFPPVGMGSLPLQPLAPPPLAPAPAPAAPAPVVLSEKKVGARVRRGLDWVWDDQDGHAGNVGTTETHSQEGWVQVRWDGTGECGVYRVGLEGAYDLFVVPPAEDPRASSSQLSALAAAQDAASGSPRLLPPWRRREDGLSPDVGASAAPAQFGLHPSAPSLVEVEPGRAGAGAADPRKRKASAASLAATDAGPAPWQKLRRRRAKATGAPGAAASAAGAAPAAAASASAPASIVVLDLADEAGDGGPFDAIQEEALRAGAAADAAAEMAEASAGGAAAAAASAEDEAQEVAAEEEPVAEEQAEEEEEVIMVVEDDEEEAAAAAEEEPEDLAAPERSAAELGLEALSLRGSAAFGEIPPELRGDREFMMVASRCCPLADMIKYASEDLRTELYADREFVLRCVEEIGADILGSAAPELRSDLGFMMEASACSSPAEAMKYAAEGLMDELEDAE